MELTGPVRFIVWTGTGEPFPPVDAADSPVDFAALAEVPGPTTPTAHVTETEAQAASLRALRKATLAEPVARNAHTPYVTVRDAEARVFRIEMRDVLPMEGPDHAVHLR
jgi:ABC-type transporter lipoprotein component MlaA